LASDEDLRENGITNGKVCIEKFTWQNRKQEGGEGSDLLFYNNSLSRELTGISPTEGTVPSDLNTSH
jgi:hypothetical protein